MVLQFVISSCYDNSLNPVLPEWEVKLTIPITKDYILTDFTDDLDYGEIFSDPEKDSQLVFGTNLSLDKIKFDNSEQILINPFVHTGKICLSDIDFTLKENFTYQEYASILFPEIPTNTYTVIPPLYGRPCQKDIQLSSFNELHTDTAEFELEIINEFPFDINITNFILSNNLNNHNEALLNKSEIYIAKNSQIDSRELIINKNIFNSLRLNFNMSTNGTGINPVYINSTSALRISFISKRVKMFYAEVSFDEQNYSSSIKFELSNVKNEIILKDAKLQDGIIDITLKNYSNIDGNFMISTDEIYQNTNNLSTQYNYLPAKGTFSQSYSLANYNITQKNNSGIIFNNSIRFNSTNNQFVTLNGNDSITYSILVRDISLLSFSGVITSNITQSFMFNKQITNYLNGNINIKEASASIFIYNGSNLPIKISDSYISGYHVRHGQTYTCKISDTEIHPSETTEINIDNAEFTKFLNNFTNDNAMPNIFNFQSQVYISTNNSNYTLSDRDTIGGYVELRIPLEVTFSNLSTSGQTDISISESEKKELENFNFGTITVHCKNGFPIEGNLRLIFLDDYGNGISFPKESLDKKYTISAADVDDRGYSVSESLSTITDTFTKEDINFIKECTKCMFEVVLNSASEKNVVIRNNDKIELTILAEFGYTIKNK